MRTGSPTESSRGAGWSPRSVPPPLRCGVRSRKVRAITAEAGPPGPQHAVGGRLSIAASGARDNPRFVSIEDVLMADTRLPAAATAERRPGPIPPDRSDAGPLRARRPRQSSRSFTGAGIAGDPAVFAHPVQPTLPAPGRGGGAAFTGIPPVCRPSRAGPVRCDVASAPARQRAVRGDRAAPVPAAIPRGDLMGADRERAVVAG
jgi:hypothetical protein